MGKRILILGAGGMAGHMVCQYLQESTEWDIIPLARGDLEVKVNGAWREQITRLNSAQQIDYIINCIGIVKPVANANPVLAMEVNAMFPHQLAELATRLNARVIHLTTDCWNDLDVYGRSKRAGEINYPNHLSLRTSIIGPELKQNGTGLFHWFMTQRGEVKGFVNHYWDGVTTLQLAKELLPLIATGTQIGGIKDLRTIPAVNKFELLQYLNSTFKRGLPVQRTETEVVDKTNANPEFVCTTPIAKQVTELKLWMDKYLPLYPHYPLVE